MFCATRRVLPRLGRFDVTPAIKGTIETQTRATEQTLGKESRQNSFQAAVPAFGDRHFVVESVYHSSTL